MFKIFIDITTQLSGARTKHEQIQIIMSVAIKYAVPYNDDLIDERKSMKKRWQRSRDVTLKAQVRFLERLIKERVNLIRNESWSHKLSTIKPNHTNVWKLTKFLKKRDSNIPPIKTADGILNTPEEKANKLAEVFESNDLNPLERSCPDFTYLIKNKVSGLRQPLPANELSTFTDADEIFSIIQNVKNLKCPGADQISNRLIKKLPRRVIQIPKPRKVKSDPPSYRPISLLSSLSKILEKVILVRLQYHIEVNNIISEEQFGFRSNSSTTHQLYKIIKHAHKGLKFKKSTGLLSLDEKAFDRIWNDELIAKTIDFDFPSNLILITKSFLSERTFKVICNGSTIRLIRAGVPQGAVLSPTLYNIYTADIPLNSFYEITMFADDT
ncbi:hypothetical protein PVAND_004037 [Polypedilum vanderplanki]|uniref:Reverse transcriptase domain-containing protein n=1 Tax=Polypedilum vanderplanki TaxID=319348 RepID=A0A9J6BWH9_POLVA|nr:hypothetical protein PVAND_004037 [Polypedilum vanderplanki]